jgi:hypothetical protein
VRRLRRAVLARLVLVVGLLVLGACDVRAEVAVDVERSGAGVVTVAVGLDPDAVERLPSLDDLVLVDDLDEAGWAVTGPDRDDDGTTWYRAEKRFATPEDATAVLAEISGPDGPFRGLTLRRELAVARTRFEFAGTVDLTGGLGAFSDAALAQALEGHPLGEPLEAIEARLGEAAAEVFSFELAVRMPGNVHSNAPATEGASPDEVVWSPSLADASPTDVAASSEVWRSTTLLALLAAAAAVVLLLAWTVTHLVIRRRRGGRRVETAAD